MNDIYPKGINWPTLGELLEEKGVSWKVYSEQDNFDDNAFEWFESFRASRPEEPLFIKGLVRSWDLLTDFKNDYVNNELPQVSIIIAPAWLSEHAYAHP